jgi:methionyl-tRNA synthetase
VKRKPFYITTPIYYVNDVPHIGHAYTTAAADVIARFQRLSGREVFFLTGTDEHGQKVEKAAAQSGESPIALADRMVRRFQDLWVRLGVSNDDFIRTTQERHIRTVQEFFKTVAEKGDIYKGVYEDWYCIPCETFWTDLQLVDGSCPTCGRPVERLKEESYFFRMSRYEKPLLDHLRKHPGFIRPKTRRNEVMRFVSDGLRDLSISRVTFKWGIPVPTDERHVIYVWFDALVNYLTAAGYGRDPERFGKWWPADVHLIGKDILRFHAVYWPCFLLSAGLPLPDRIVTHGWWTVEGEKMSKSKGNVVDPNLMIERYGADAFRFFLLREVPFGDDGDFSEASLVQRFNSELANDLGNLMSRTLTMIERYSEGRIPSPAKTATADDRKLRSAAAGLYKKVSSRLDDWAFHLALREIWKVVDLANRYIERNAPWELAKDAKKRKRLDTVLYHLAESLRVLSLYLYPFMPETGKRMREQLGLDGPISTVDLSKDHRWGKLKAGTSTRKGKQLFPRIEAAPSPETPKKEETRMTQTEMTKSMIDIEDFRKIDFRTGRIVSAEPIPGADKLLKLMVDIGTETRQVVAGIATRYKPEALVGMNVILVANLKPARIRGVESQGMILAAGDKEVEALATFLESPEPGTTVK